MVTPKIERANESRDYGKFTISPLERGFGVTLGNALRRVLLSSLDGAAVSSVRIMDVQHEFSTIPGVREDVIQLMLQIKQLRMKLHNNIETAQIHLEVKGEGTITKRLILFALLRWRLLTPSFISLVLMRKMPMLKWI